jgi:hypothetical protein
LEDAELTIALEGGSTFDITSPMGNPSTASQPFVRIEATANDAIGRFSYTWRNEIAGELYDAGLFTWIPGTNRLYADVPVRKGTNTIETIVWATNLEAVGFTTVVNVHEFTYSLALANAAVSTTIVSDAAIIAERSIYWPGLDQGWRETHNSFGVTATGLRWGLADVRLGGARGYATYVLLANPNPVPAEVAVRFLRTGAAPVIREYTVAPTSRMNVWVNNEAPEIGEGTFSVDVQVLNHQPIAVEKALYWNSEGAVWAGGTNVTATMLPPR